MQSYRLVFADDGIGVARRVEFEAEDLAHALIFAHREAKHRSAELWHGGLRLCSITRPEPGFSAAAISQQPCPREAAA